MQCSKSTSLDHLIGTGEQRRRHRKAERPSGLEIDRQLVLGRRLHRKVGRFFALEDAVDVRRCAPVLINIIGTIGNEAAVGDIDSLEVDRRKLMSGRKRNDQIAMNDRQRTSGHDQTAVRGERKCAGDKAGRWAAGYRVAI